MQKTFLRMALIVPLVFGPLAFGPLAFGTPAFADTHGKAKPESPSEMIGEATRTILRAFEMMIKSIPQYEAPEILDNGDIIIRRKRPESEKPAPPKPPAKTKT